MNSIQKLLTKLCPEGVRFYPLEDVFDIRNGYTPSKSTPEFWENGTIPWFRMEDIRENGGILSDSIQKVNSKAVKGKLFPKDSIIIATSATIGDHALLLVDSIANQRFTYLSTKNKWKDKLNPMFSYYYCFVLGEWCRNNTNISGFASVNMDGFRKFKFPIPPLPVQEEIVWVLDKFTLLKAELEAELEARTLQYEHYRDALLDFSIIRSSIIKELIEGYSIQTIEYKSLAEIATEMYRGTGITRSQVTEAGIPCVRYGEIYTTYGTFFDKCVSFTNEKSIKNPKYFGYGDILFAITGENVEEISKSTAYIGNEVCLAGGDIVVMKHEQNPKYLAYALSTTNAQRQKSKGKIKSKVVHSSVPDLKKIKIPVPPLPVQEAIVDILDRFEAIVHDIQDGLPAEIALRQKQYEYYRDKLLTFEPLEPEAKAA